MVNITFANGDVVTGRWVLFVLNNEWVLGQVQSANGNQVTLSPGWTPGVRYGPGDSLYFGGVTSAGVVADDGCITFPEPPPTPHTTTPGTTTEGTTVATTTLPPGACVPSFYVRNDGNGAADYRMIFRKDGDIYLDTGNFTILSIDNVACGGATGDTARTFQFTRYVENCDFTGFEVEFISSYRDDIVACCYDDGVSGCLQVGFPGPYNCGSCDQTSLLNGTFPIGDHVVITGSLLEYIFGS